MAMFFMEPNFQFLKPQTQRLAFCLVFFGMMAHVPNLLAQCTPTAATLCASGDDITTVYAGGSLLGTFGYAGAPGTNGAGNPTCMTVSTSLLTGAQVCLAIETQNTNPEDNFSSWDLDITCSGGNHSEITSSGSGISVDYISSGNPAPTPSNDSSSNPWYSTAFSGGSTFSTSFCSGGVTAATWAEAIYNPLTGKQLPFIANNCSGDYSTGNTDGALYWHQCTTIPPPQPTLPPPNITISKTAASTLVSGQDVTIEYNLVVCNTGGPVTNGPTTVTDNLIVNNNQGTCNAFQVTNCWGYGDSVVPYSLCYQNNSGLADEPSVNSNQLIFPNFGTGCVTATYVAVNYYDDIAGCGITLVDQASVTWPNGNKTSGNVTYIQLMPTNTFTQTYTRTPSYTPTPTYTHTVTPTFTVTRTNTVGTTPTYTPTQTYTQTHTPTNTPTNTPTPTRTPTITPTNTPTVTPTNTNTRTNTFTPTVTPTNTPTNTPTVSPTFTRTVTPTNTLTVTPTNTPTVTFTKTNTVTPTNTYTPTVQFTNTNTPTVTPTKTNTVTSTNTNTVTPTVTPRTPTR